jgi:predicted nucleic acid-binding protein
MIVIADTSPINYLVLIEQIEVLPTLYGQILIPPSVGLLDFREALARLRSTNFYIAQEILDRLIRGEEE